MPTLKPSFAAALLAFLDGLGLPVVPEEVEVLNPLADPAVRAYAAQFYARFYGDRNQRVCILGINPGRFGSGTTGVPFIDPVSLRELCGIDNALPPRRELSAQFVEQVVRDWGGPGRFYRDFFITAVCPWGFTRGGKNYNYYDSPQLLASLEPLLVAKLQEQLDTLPVSRRVAIVLGAGKNMAELDRLNAAHGFFEHVVALEHPRFIMQYRRKRVDEYIAQYRTALRDALDFATS
jgi:hypothetical protein